MSIPRRTRLIALVLTWASLAACGSTPAEEFADVGDLGTTSDTGTDAAADVLIDASMSDIGFTDALAQDVAPSDSAPTDARSDAPSDTAVSDVPAPDADVAPTLELQAACAIACDERDTQMGGCPVSEEGGCAEWCADAGAGLDDETVAALLACVSVDPLCFQTPLQCIANVLYPEPFRHSVILRGSGYDAWEGRRVYAAIEQRADDFVRLEGVVEGGRFELVFDVLMRADHHSALFFIDADADAVCTPGVDWGASASFDLWSLPRDTFELPEWIIESVYDPERDSSWVCDYF